MLSLFTIGYGRPDLLAEQKRLLDKHLKDNFGLCMIDNTPADSSASMMEQTCARSDVGYLRVPSIKHDHQDALKFAALHVTQEGSEFFGFLDHDIFPIRETTLLDKIKQFGFYGMGQRHAPTGKNYLWPGFCFFSKEWLNYRPLNFGGVRGVERRDDGDCGSMNWQLFCEENWEGATKMAHEYHAIRQEDSFGLQSWGYETIGDWIHLTNASNWMRVPDPLGRDRAFREILSEL